MIQSSVVVASTIFLVDSVMMNSRAKEAMMNFLVMVVMILFGAVKVLTPLIQDLARI